jgi:hypothetical protein
MRCGDCKGTKNVQLCQGDLILCESCNNLRFPKMSTVTPSGESKMADDAEDATVTGPVIDELLCFVFNKLGMLPHDDIVKLCIDTYSATEIEASKRLLFKLCDSGEFRFIKRTGQARSTNNMSDIMKLAHMLEYENTPCFVAADLSKLPSVTTDYIDMSSFMHDVAVLKAEMKVVKETTNKMVDSQSLLGHRVQNMATRIDDAPARRTVVLSDTAEAKKTPVQVVDTNSRPKSTPPRSAVRNSSTNVEADVHVGDATGPWSRASDVESDVQTKLSQLRQTVSTLVEATTVDEHLTVTDQSDLQRGGDRYTLRSTDGVRGRTPAGLQPARQCTTVAQQSADRPGVNRGYNATTAHVNIDDVRREMDADDANMYAEVLKHTINADGFTAVQGRRRSPNIGSKQGVIGTADSGALRGVRQVTKAELFVSRLDPATLAKDVAAYLSKRGVDAQCTRLATKFDTYASFQVTADRRQLNILNNPDTWPTDVLVRRFYQKRTAPADGYINNQI